MAYVCTHMCYCWIALHFLYYRWNGELQIMEWYKDGAWVTHGWTPASLMRYRDSFSDVTLNVVTEDEVR